jgi:hypothetical protein
MCSTYRARLDAAVTLYRNQIHHVRMYNAAALRAQLEATGFEGVQMRGVGFLPLSSRFGRSALSQNLANAFPALCSNLLAIARKPQSMRGLLHPGSAAGRPTPYPDFFERVAALTITQSTSIRARSSLRLTGKNPLTENPSC